MPLDVDEQHRIEAANRERRIFKTSPREYHVPTTLLERALVRLGGATFWLGTGVVALLLLLYLYLFNPVVGAMLQLTWPSSGWSWAFLLFVAVPLFVVCWLVIIGKLGKRQ